MASNFTLLSKKFFNQIRNNTDFNSNTSDFNTNLTDNVADVTKLIEQIELSVDYNIGLTNSIGFSTLPFDATFASIKSGADFYTEGFYPGASIRFTRGSNTSDATILQITGVGNGEIKFSDADGTAMISNLGIVNGGNYTDISIKLLSVPTSITFKYGLNPIGSTGENYQSPLDSNIQAYYAKSIPTSPTFQAMAFQGGQNGASLGTVEIAYITTLDSYRHRFELRHTFKTPYFISGQKTNLETATAPANLASSNTLRYDNRYEMGTPAYKNSIFVNSGAIGNVGYFNENYNGLENPYTVENLVVTNASGTGKLESTEVNTISFDIVTTGTFGSGIAGIIGHSKLPTTLEYQNQTTAFDDIWIYSNLRNIEGSATSSGGVFSNFEFNITSSNTINVTADVSFSASEQLIISDTSNYLLWFTIANEDLTDPELIDRVNLIVDVNNYSRNSDVSGLVLNHDIRFWPSWEAYTGQSAYTNFTGGDGDIWGMKCTFNLDTTRNARVVRASFKILADNGSNTFPVGKPINFPLGLPTETTDGTYNYQLVNVETVNTLNLPNDDTLKQLKSTIELPLTSPSVIQSAEFQTGFQVPWRDWTANPNVPTIFHDPTKPNNNRNEKTSNYSGVNSYEIYGVMELEVSNNVETDNTIVQIYSDASTILDFDSASWTGFTGDTKFFNEDGEEVFNVEDGQDITIKIELTHSLGVLAAADLAAFAWIEINQSTTAPTYLSSERDWISDSNRLQATEEVTPGNALYLEIESVSNKVTLIAKTNSINITPDIQYIVRGRLWNKV